jgi:hypothetical protein
LTRNKVWRISLAAILGFGWLFLTPASYSDDPLSIAAQEIAELNEDVATLTEKAETQRLIDIAEDKYDAAVAAKAARDSAYATYDAAAAAEETALSELNLAQSAVDGQTVTVATALTNKNNAQDALDIANINLSNTPVPSVGYQGVAFEIYPLSRYGNYAYIAPGSGLWCQGGIPTFDAYAGWGAICGANQNFIGIFRARLTVPANINSVYFAAATDDGSRIYVDGVLESELWEEQGTTWSPYTRTFNTTTDKTLDLEVWWYNGGGPGNMHVGWGHSGIWTGIPNAYLSYGQGSSQEVIDAYNTALAAKQAAQAVYNDKLSVYNSANQTLTAYNQTLATKTTGYSTAQTNTSNALTAKNNATSTYDQSIIDMNDAIDDAQEEYNKQSLFEEQQRVAAAIAAAMANQPQPTPEPTIIDPTPEPSPEQTQPVDPTPEPSSDTTDEPTPEPTVDPEPTVEPSPEPSPQPSDIDPEPTPEPEPTPAEPSEEPSQTNTITEETANLIADLTSKDTLTKLSPEQKAAVAEGLGIKTEELAKVAALAASEPTIAKALEEFGDRIKENAAAPMPYTLADATTEIATEAFLSDPIGAIADIDFEKLLSPSEWGKDMTDDQREKAQEVIVPVVIAANIVAAAMTRRI